jgi:hypothetical protein
MEVALPKDEAERDEIRAIMDGIIAAHEAVSPMLLVPPESFAAYAQAALASLELSGFKVVRDA